ncbi:hypothetical protein C8R48DRAFT_780066 [Suillus tomentosus]|nr:hypothetical protein C8R48DRAFT_780066 [Suillus tomentosus]
MYTLECHSLSDDEPELADEHHELQPVEDPVKAARALYNFEGKAEFRELTIEAGDKLNVLKEEAGDGWSLMRVSSGEIGLLTQTYYTCTTSFLSAPLAVHGRNEPPISTITPQASFQHQSKPLSIVPQDTGEWTNPLPSFRQSLLRGKTLNRFSGFMTSGAEEWVLEGYVDPVIPSSSSSHQRISTEDSINDDNTRLSRLGLGKQTLALHGNLKFQSFGSWLTHLQSAHESYDPYIPPISPTRITVQWRFSHFIVLHTSTRRLPGIALPPLFFAHVFHPTFNVDVNVIDRFSRHTLAKTSDGLQIVADLYDDHMKARRTQLATHDAFKSVAHPYQLELCQSTVSRYKDALRLGKSNDEMAARCETVLNITMAEMDTYHDQKVENFSTITREYLDGEIHFYKQVLHKLKAARRTFNALRTCLHMQPFRLGHSFD